MTQGDVEMAKMADAGVEKQKSNNPHVETMSPLRIGMLMTMEIAAMLVYAFCTEYSDATTGTGNTGGNLHQYYAMYQDVHVMIFIGFGFLMTFMKKYGFSATGYNFLLAALTIQYAILINGFFHALFKDDWHKIQLDVVSLITGDFAAGAVLISFGAVLGKASLEQLVVMMACEIIFYSLNESIGVEKMFAVDMGGSMYVHMFGAYFGMAVSYMITKKEKVEAAAEKFGSSTMSDMTAMVGTLFLWMFWPSFNGVLATGNAQHRVVLNTVLSLTNSCVAAFFMSKIMRPTHKFNMVDIQNATLAGGVAVGSSSDMVIGPWASLLIGFAAGCVSVVGYNLIQPALEKKGLHDTCGVHNLHGLPGLMGGIGGAISATAAKNQVYGDSLLVVFPAMCPTDLVAATAAGCSATGEGRTKGEQGAFQFATTCITLGIAIFGGLITGYIMNQVHEQDNYGDDSDTWDLEEEEEASMIANKL